MIFGLLERRNNRRFKIDHLDQAIASADLSPEQRSVYRDGPLFLYYSPPFETIGYKQLKPAVSKDKSLAAAFTGRIYNDGELCGQIDSDPRFSDAKNSSSLILSLYERYGLDFVKKLNGKFAFALWDKAQQKLVLGRDRLGIEPLYYYSDDEVIIFASSIPLIFKYTTVEKELNLAAVGKFLVFNYNPSLQTFFRKFYRLRPAHLLVLDHNEITIHRYWKVPFGKTTWKDENEIAERLLFHLRDAVSIRMDDEARPGVFISGGMDSSTVLALASEIADTPLNTFSYHCVAESFNESHYARIMAEKDGAKHQEIEYSGQDILSIREIVKEMNEPFCDVGINIATYILGKKASQKNSYVLTGDGGDELFGGHPVYEADKIAQFLDPIPNFLRSPFFALFSSLPDSDKKKNLVVKLKRFSENLKLPKALLSHRWRVYYQADELNQLLNPSISSEIMQHDLFEDILQINHEAEGPDLLSRALYSDYQTVVDFYLRRNDLNRHLRLETRFPLLDHRLVEFCAQIPSKMKVRGWFDTKYIFKKTMEKVLPAEIVHRKDKLGHSIPLKNWIRDNSQVREFVLDYLSEAAIKRRGYFKPEYISDLVKDHMSKRRNNSHRLWALAVLEMWFRKHVD